MINNDVVWDGASTSIQLRSQQQVTKQQWIIVAVMSGAPFRIMKESGKLIRSVPAESEVLHFALAKPTGQDLWLLGNAV
jgi:hypothetical protein